MFISLGFSREQLTAPSPPPLEQSSCYGMAWRRAQRGMGCPSARVPINLLPKIVEAFCCSPLPPSSIQRTQLFPRVSCLCCCCGPACAVCRHLSIGTISQLIIKMRPTAPSAGPPKHGRKIYYHAIMAVRALKTSKIGMLHVLLFPIN